MKETTGVLLARDDGVIDVPQALPWPTQFAEQIVRTLDAILGPVGNDEHQQRTEDET